MAVVINGSGTVTGLAVGGLPDGTVDAGTLATDSVTAAKLKDDAIAVGDLPAGSVLQVVSGSDSTVTSSSSSTYADTGLSLSITPSSTSSRVLVLVNHNGCGKTNNNTYLQVRLLRDSTAIHTIHGYAGENASTARQFFGSVSCSYLDSPATISAVTYKTQSASGANSGYAYINQASNSTIVLMEVAV